jgi:hypothetical protein
MTSISAMLAGAVAFGYLATALFFFRFWTRSRDQLFLCFSAAFALLSLNQLLAGLHGAAATEAGTIFYLLRLAAFGLIIFAILRKNVSGR